MKNNQLPFRRQYATLFNLLLVALFAVIVVRNAWLNDDAYITFRTIDNFVNGYGLTWNIAERVQSFTHPLWLFVLTIPYAITREIYYTSLFVSIAVSAVTVGMLGWQLQKRPLLFLLIFLTLIFSKAYIDYSTSGLENPLTHLLIVIFFTIYFADNKFPAKNRLFWLGLVTALAILNRTDTLFLFALPLLWAWWQNRTFTSLGWLFIGFTPLILWEMFSIFYYGFPFPNTAYAKAFNTGIPELALWQAGWHYLQNSFRWDPLTLTVIGLALLAAVFRRKLSYLAVAFGIFCYLLYVVKIGGDFMSGRFLTAPFITAVTLLIPLYPKKLHSTAVVLPLSLIISLIGWQAQFPPLLNGGDFGTRPEQTAWDTWHDDDIADERVYYYPFTGLINPNRQIHPWQAQGEAVRQEQPPIAQHGNIGFFGYHAGPRVHILDPNALADPLLARLPVANPDDWRIGHLRRNVPDGYIETLISGENQLQDPVLSNYYDKLSLVIRGDLTDWQRIPIIWELNTTRPYE